VWTILVGDWARGGVGVGALGVRDVQAAPRPENGRAAQAIAPRGGQRPPRERAQRARAARVPRAEKLDPKNPRVHYALADAYLSRAGKAAERSSTRAARLELFPDYHDARAVPAGVLLSRAAMRDVIAECDRLVDDPTFPSPWRALTNRAWAEYKLGQTKRARESLALAREYRATIWPATLALAIVEGDRGPRTEAIRLYQEIIAQ
jgi:Tfp pilus assembly protein PilF